MGGCTRAGGLVSFFSFVLFLSESFSGDGDRAGFVLACLDEEERWRQIERSWTEKMLQIRIRIARQRGVVVDSRQRRSAEKLSSENKGGSLEWMMMMMRVGMERKRRVAGRYRQAAG